MKIYEYIGLTIKEAEQLKEKHPEYLEELNENGPMPPALLDFASSRRKLSKDDELELRRFGEFLRLTEKKIK